MSTNVKTTTPPTYSYAEMCDIFMKNDWDVAHKSKYDGFTRKQLNDKKRHLNDYIKRHNLPCEGFIYADCLCIRRSDRYIPFFDDKEQVEAREAFIGKMKVLREEGKKVLGENVGQIKMKIFFPVIDGKDNSSLDI